MYQPKDTTHQRLFHNTVFGVNARPSPWWALQSCDAKGGINGSDSDDNGYLSRPLTPSSSNYHACK